MIYQLKRYDISVLPENVFTFFKAKRGIFYTKEDEDTEKAEEVEKEQGLEEGGGREELVEGKIYILKTFTPKEFLIRRLSRISLLL